MIIDTLIIEESLLQSTHKLSGSKYSTIFYINYTRFTREADAEGMTSFNKKFTACAADLTKKVPT